MRDCLNTLQPGKPKERDGQYDSIIDDSFLISIFFGGKLPILSVRGEDVPRPLINFGLTPSLLKAIKFPYFFKIHTVKQTASP